MARAERHAFDTSWLNAMGLESAQVGTCETVKLALRGR
jgi:hypothetical protein